MIFEQLDVLFNPNKIFIHSRCDSPDTGQYIAIEKVKYAYIEEREYGILMEIETLLTSTLKKTTQPTRVFIPKEIGFRKDSMVLCENIECMSKYKLGDYITTLPKEYMAQVAVGNILSLSAISFIDPDLLMNVWQKALALNAIAN